MTPNIDPKSFKFVYGPIWSWRLGSSLGIDPVAAKDKICNYDCTYCQLGPTLKYYTKPEIFVTKQDLAGELARIDFMDQVDALTFSGRGEPTLAKNLDELIETARTFGPKQIAVITNGALFSRKDVCRAVCLSDFVILKVDAGAQDVFEAVDKPAKGMSWSQVSKGIRQFRKMFKGILSIRVMFIKSNLAHAPEIAKTIADMGADEIELDTPIRKCPEDPVSKKDLKNILPYFSAFCDKVYSVYDAKPESKIISSIGEARKRHGISRTP